MFVIMLGGGRSLLTRGMPMSSWRNYNSAAAVV